MLAMTRLANSRAARPAAPFVRGSFREREALTNAAKHSQATRIGVDVRYLDPRSVRVTVTDDGVGFDPEQPRNGRYGLVGIYERASRIGAALTLATEPGAGTEIVAVWPND